MIVPKHHRLIFFHNPKCAGTSFRDALMPYHDDPTPFWGVFVSSYFQSRVDHAHLGLWELHPQFPGIFACTETYMSVVFVRNPGQRFLSAVNEHMKSLQPHANLAAMDSVQRTAHVERFIREDIGIVNIIADWRLVRFSP